MRVLLLGVCVSRARSQMLFRRQPPIPTAAETPLSDRLLLTTDTYRGVEKLHEHYLAVTKARRAAGKKVY